MHTVKYFRAACRAGLFGLAALVLGACGSGSDSPPPSSGPNAEPTSEAEASRFLAQASFGASMSSVDNHEDSGIPAGPAIKYSTDLHSNGSISPIHSAVVTASPPIYLLNLALLC